MLTGEDVCLVECLRFTSCGILSAGLREFKCCPGCACRCVVAVTWGRAWRDRLDAVLPTGAFLDLHAEDLGMMIVTDPS